MKKHSDYGGSVSDKWLSCPGYAQAVAGLPSSPSNHASALGTALHALCERFLTTGGDPSKYIDQPWITPDAAFPGEAYDDSCVDVVSAWARMVFEHSEPMTDEVHIESSITMSSVAPEIYGSADFIAYNRAEKTLVIIDLKTGRSFVPANSTQLMFYAVAASDTFNLPIDASWKITLAICQPALSNYDTVVVNGDTLVEARGVFRYAYMQSKREDAPRIAGDHCKYCKAAGNCNARAAQTALTMRKEFAAPSAAGLTSEQRVKILQAEPAITSFLEDVKAHSFALALAGTPDPGTTLTAGRKGNRAWIEGAEDALKTRFGERAYVRKIISPADAEKITGKNKLNELEEFIAQSPGKPTLSLDPTKAPYSKLESAKMDFA